MAFVAGPTGNDAVLCIISIVSIKIYFISEKISA